MTTSEQTPPKEPQMSEKAQDAAGVQIPWWAPATPAKPEKRASFRDLWDAVFGRHETFIRVEHGGSWFICEPRDAWEFKGTAADGDVYVTTEVRMTRRQFNALPEFEGF